MSFFIDKKNKISGNDLYTYKRAIIYAVYGTGNKNASQSFLKR